LLLVGNSKLELLLGLGGSVELLVDGDVVGVEDDVSGSRIRVSLEDAFRARRDG
jgi:hypothetical protein